MSSNSSWVPNEDPLTLFSERCWLQGAFVSSVAYGVTVCLYFSSLHLLCRSQNHISFKKRLPFLIYITVAFLLGTLFMVSLAAFTQMAFIDDRNYPGGPNMFENNMFSIPIDDLGNVVFVLSNWMCDALVVWRFKVIYQDSRIPAWILMFFPCLMLLGSVVLGIMFLNQVSTTNAYVTNSVNFTLPYLGLSLALNIILTIAIVIRLLRFRYRITSLLGPKYGTQYTSMAAMLIESAALYSAVSIAFLALFGTGSAVSQVFLQSLSQFQTIATFLIVFRLAQGKGWTGETATRVMTTRTEPHVELGKMQFPPHAASVTLTSPGEMAKDSSGEFQEDHFVSSDVFARKEIV